VLWNVPSLSSASSAKRSFGMTSVIVPSFTCFLSPGTQPTDRKRLPAAFGSPESHSTRYSLGDH